MSPTRSSTSCRHRGGRVVMISSLSGTLSSVLVGAYSMSKHAVEGYTDTLAVQMEPHGVHVVAVAPGNYDSRIVTNVAERFDAPAGAAPELLALYENPGAQDRSAFPPPDDVAEACLAALFDEVPLARYLVVPVVDEADRMLAQAAAEWARLNVSTPYTWTLERLVEEVERASAG
ncbi:MAG: SDR family NAD(P)-dependent oxidoreductase [Trueperaceae bacterium]